MSTQNRHVNHKSLTHFRRTRYSSHWHNHCLGRWNTWLLRRVQACVSPWSSGLICAQVTYGCIAARTAPGMDYHHGGTIEFAGPLLVADIRIPMRMRSFVGGPADIRVLMRMQGQGPVRLAGELAEGSVCNIAQHGQGNTRFTCFRTCQPTITKIITVVVATAFRSRR
jgi:hypothetical protein